MGGHIEMTFADRLLSVDAAAARLCGELSAGRSLSVLDTLIRGYSDHAWAHLDNS
jgi:hypothetical protein